MMKSSQLKIDLGNKFSIHHIAMDRVAYVPLSLPLSLSLSLSQFITYSNTYIIYFFWSLLHI